MAKKLSKKFAVIALSLVGLGLVGGAFYIKSQQSNDTGTAAEQEAGAKDIDTSEDKSATVEQSQQENQAANALEADFSLSLVRAGQSGQGQTVEIRAYVSGASSGSCTASFTGPGTSFSKSSSITSDGRTYSCGAVDALASSFSTGGIWSYSLKATSGSKISNTLQGQFEVKK